MIVTESENHTNKNISGGHKFLGGTFFSICNSQMHDLGTEAVELRDLRIHPARVTCLVQQCYFRTRFTVR